jgi:hypothetical protein
MFSPDKEEASSGGMSMAAKPFLGTKRATPTPAPTATPVASPTPSVTKKTASTIRKSASPAELGKKAKAGVPPVQGKDKRKVGVQSGAGSNDSSSETVRSTLVSDTSKEAGQGLLNMVTPPAPGLPSEVQANSQFRARVAAGAETGNAQDIQSQRTAMNTAIQDYRNESDVNRKREMWDLIIQNLGKMTAGAAGMATKLDVGSKFQPTDTHDAAAEEAVNKGVMNERIKGTEALGKQSMENRSKGATDSIDLSKYDESTKEKILAALGGITRNAGYTQTGEASGTTNKVVVTLPPVGEPRASGGGGAPSTASMAPQTPGQQSAIEVDKKKTNYVLGKTFTNVNDLKNYYDTQGGAPINVDKLWQHSENEIKNKANKSGGKTDPGVLRKATADLVKFYLEMMVEEFPSANDPVAQAKFMKNRALLDSIGFRATDYTRPNVQVPKTPGAGGSVQPLNVPQQ